MRTVIPMSIAPTSKRVLLHDATLRDSILNVDFKKVEVKAIQTCRGWKMEAGINRDTPTR
jgi:hypothetical protein